MERIRFRYAILVYHELILTSKEYIEVTAVDPYWLGTLLAVIVSKCCFCYNHMSL